MVDILILILYYLSSYFCIYIMSDLESIGFVNEFICHLLGAEVVAILIYFFRQLK